MTKISNYKTVSQLFLSFISLLTIYFNDYYLYATNLIGIFFLIEIYVDNSKLDYLLHHLFGLCIVYSSNICVMNDVNIFVIRNVLIVELSTIFLVLNKYITDENYILKNINKFLFVSTFIYTRIYTFGKNIIFNDIIMNNIIETNYNEINLAIINIGLYGLFIVNIYWTILIINKIINLKFVFEHLIKF
jgi:hypothetical protein